MTTSNNKNKTRVFLGVLEICGYYATLQQSLNQLGIPASFVNFVENQFQYQKKENHPKVILFLVRLIRKSFTLRTAPESPLLLKISWFALEFFSRIVVFFWAIFNFNVFIFGFTSSMLWLTELPILKILGKRIIFVFNGSDSRPAYLSGLYYSPDLNSAAKTCIKTALWQKRIIRWIERFADVIINHPPSSHFHEKKFIAWLNVGIPALTETELSTGTIQPPIDSTNSITVRIVHAPSRPEQKGTSIIREIIEKIRGEGHFNIEFIEMIGRKNQEVLTELSRCDFVIDELYSDTPMASLAAEAAFFGKPSVVGGYINSADLGVNARIIPPSEFVHPKDTEKAIRKLISDRPYREDLGKKAQEFVKNSWASQKIAERFLLLIEGTIPEEWFYSPQNINYLYGWGLPEEKIQPLIKTVIQLGGKSALQLSDKPILENKLVKFSETEE
jgi:glycosyltransferase involved in cell wall biosynthesis